jgi:hypothetical protein
MARAAAWAGPRWQARHHQEPRSNPLRSRRPAPRMPLPRAAQPPPRHRQVTEAKESCPWQHNPTARPPVRITPTAGRGAPPPSTGGDRPASGGRWSRGRRLRARDDAHLLEWMTGQVTGMARYAEALIEPTRPCRRGRARPEGPGRGARRRRRRRARRRDHGRRQTKFTDHYELPREFAGNGGLMPHDGRWVHRRERLTRCALAPARPGARA